jgi:predicted nucleic acid-binding protein
MSDISDLADPHPSYFYQPNQGNGISASDTDIFIGKRALEGLFHTESDDLNEKQSVKKRYSENFIKYIQENEIPFRTIHTTRETLNIAITSLGHGNNDQDGANKCLNTVIESELFRLHHCSSSKYDQITQEFLGYNPRTISIQEVILAVLAQDNNITHLLTWDSDFTRYNDEIVLYPRNYWE